MKFLYLCIVLITILSSDHQIRGYILINTDSLSWILTNSNGSITVPGSAPGGVYSDLLNAGVLNQGDFYYRYNDLDYRWVSYDDWNYTTLVDLPASLFNNSRVVFEFDGLDTAVDVVARDTINLGGCQNMFSRCIIDITDQQNLEGLVQLTFHFRSPVQYSQSMYDNYFNSYGYYVVPDCVVDAFKGECHANMNRKMQASFSWDWGPAFPNLGIWKRWRIIGWNSVKISSVMFESYPTSPLPEQVDLNLLAEWIVYYKVYFDVGATQGPIDGTLQVTIQGQEYSTVISLDTDNSVNGTVSYNSSFIVPPNTVETWWPNGYGGQSLYTLMVTFAPADFPGEISPKSVKVGFRTVELDQSFVNASNESIGRYFRFKINNVLMFLMGSNWIPAHVLPELVTPEYTRLLLEGARDTHQNCLRVWGGGIYESDDFYNIADELGLLLWEDMMFACSMYPADDNFLQSVANEVRTQVQRLQYHPSILLWATNNENEAALRDNWYGTISDFSVYKQDYIKLYVDVVASILKEEDSSRSVVISSPSNGIESEEEGYIALNPYDNHYGDTHFYNYRSNGWKWEIYPKTRFASEYGFQSFPSYQTLLPVFSSEDMQIDSPMMEHRQHHPGGQSELDDQLTMHFDYSATTSSFKYYLYLTQLHQAMAIKTESEFYRRIRDTLFPDGTGLTMGALYWQLNDIWQGASWASIEYGGRWKILHYFVKKFFNPVAVIPWIEDTKLTVTIVNDSPNDLSVNGTFPSSIIVRVRKFVNETVPNYVTREITTSVPSQSAVSAVELDIVTDLQIDSSCTSGISGVPLDNCFITVEMRDYGGIRLAPDNFVLLSEPKDNYLPAVNFNVTVVQNTNQNIDLSITSSELALFVFLESPFVGVFSDNGFILPAFQQLDLQFFGTQFTPENEFRDSLNVTHVVSS